MPTKLVTHMFARLLDLRNEPFLMFHIDQLSIAPLVIILENRVFYLLDHEYATEYTDFLTYKETIPVTIHTQMVH